MIIIYQVAASLIKYLFIGVIYLFIYWVARLIYLDIVTIKPYRSRLVMGQPYLKLLTPREHLSVKVENSYPLGEITTIGRSVKNDIVLPDVHISGSHARIAGQEGKYIIEDNGSTNGTFVNGRKIKEPVLLKNGDRISFRQIEFRFVISD